jgi:hypothetical protein
MNLRIAVEAVIRALSDYRSLDLRMRASAAAGDVVTGHSTMAQQGVSRIENRNSLVVVDVAE